MKIFIILLISSTYAFSECHEGQMSCSNICVVDELGLSFQCNSPDNSVYCDADTGHCDVDINGVNYQGDIVKLLSKLPSKHRR